jgi:hypothetical protein
MEQERERRLRLLSTIILGLGTAFSSWSAFEGARQNAASSQATTLHVKAARQAARADQQAAVHVGFFVAWAQAVADENSPEQLKRHGYLPGAHAHSSLILKRFPKEFRPAMTAWLATRPFQNPDAPSTPFNMPEYRLEPAETAAQFDDRAEARSAAAKDASLHADRFVALPVLFSTALFLAGMGVQRSGGRMQEVMLGLASLILVSGCVALAAVELS